MTDAFVEKISDIAAMIGIGVGVVAWWFAREDANRKSIELDLYKEESKKAVAEAHAASEDAKKIAAIANRDAEQAKLEAARLKDRFAWRQITEEQKKILIADLKKSHGKAQIEFTANDPESMYFATQIRNLFRHAGWQTSFVANEYFHTICWGLNISGGRNETEQERAVNIAFVKADMEYFLNHPTPTPVSLVRVEGEVADEIDSVIVRVGSKPQNPDFK